MIESFRCSAAIAVVLVVASPALADGTHSGGHAEHGTPGAVPDAGRTVEVIMFDTYYEPGRIAVTAGETVRFRVRNAGSLVHEFNIGTAAMHAAHRPEMQMLVDHGILTADRFDAEKARAMQASMGHGMHDHPNSVLLDPGETGEIVWTFPTGGVGAIEFACNVPGHYEAGMVGTFTPGGGH